MSQKESDLYKSLNETRIISLFIEGEIYPYMRFKDIENLIPKFGLKYIQTKKNGINVSRTDLMHEIFDSLSNMNKTYDFLNYYIYHKNLGDEIDRIISDNNEYSIFEEPRYPEIADITEKSTNSVLLISRFLRKRFIDAVNSELIYADCKLVSSNNKIHISSSDNLNFKDKLEFNNLVSNESLKEIVSNAQFEIENGDFYTVITKARTILENVFIQILEERHVEFKRNGDIGKYRSLVNDSLGMKHKENWPMPVTKLVGGINTIIDSISDMRNNGSDAHASKDEYYAKKAEVCLIMNSAISIASYYISVSDRQNY